MRATRSEQHRVCRLRTLLLCVLLAPGILALPTFAQAPSDTLVSASSVPPLVRFSGRAKDGNNLAISGQVNLTFSIYKEPSGGTALWSESQNTQADAQGNYTVLLGAGSKAGLPTALFSSGDARWLGVRVGDAAEQPRTLLLSVPYAIKAGDAETLGGMPLSAFVLAGSSAGASATSTTSTIAAAAGATGSSSTSNAPTTLPNITGKGTSGYIPKFSTASTVANSTIFDNGNIGVGTNKPQAKLDVVGSIRISGAGGNLVFPDNSVQSTATVQGPAGPQGPAGAAGPAGPAGPTGATGTQGQPGPAGAQGPAGPAGPTGATGATGAQGQAGPTGAQGPAGPVGPTGPMGLVGPQGPQGAAGPAGPQGITNQGVWSSATSYNPNDGVSFNGSYWIALIANSASQPDQFPASWQLVAQKGDAGAVGPVGATGATGPQGPTGATGAQGPAGATGATGAQGVPGSIGPVGPAGAQGPAGPGNVLVVATTSATTSITANCTNYSGGTVTVNVTVGQTVEVVGTVWLLINHTAGIRDHGRVVVGTSSTDCNGGSSYYWVPFTVSPTLASDNVFDLVVPVRGVFVAPTTGSVTYYLNALVDSTSPNVNFWFGNLAAHVY